MKPFARALLVLLVAASCDAPPSRHDQVHRMLAGADDLDRRFVEAVNRGDVDAVMTCYWKSPDVVSQMPGTMMVRGWEAVRADLAEFLGSMPGARLTLTEHQNRVEGDVVVGWGLWTLTASGGDSAPVIGRGRYLDVKALRDGAWVYLFDSASVPMADGG